MEGEDRWEKRKRKVKKREKRKIFSVTSRTMFHYLQTKQRKFENHSSNEHLSFSNASILMENLIDKV